MQKERWKSIKGYIGMYEVSDFGRIRSLDRVSSDGKKLKGKVLKKYIRFDGYCTNAVSKNGKVCTKKIHILVADAFIKKDKTRKFINHKNGDKSNNYYKNIERVTFKENMIHAYDTGLNNTYGENHHNGRLSNKQVLEIFDSALTVRELKEKYKIPQQVVSDIKTGRKWSRITGAKKIKI